MSEKNPITKIHWDVKNRQWQCENVAKQCPMDMTRVPLCPKEKQLPSTKNPNCGCPEEFSDCWCCQMPSTIETRMLRTPRTCIKLPCNYTIPAIPCYEPREKKLPMRDPLCFDWTVDEPGPNDSYGLNGLNWHDWKMEGIGLIYVKSPSNDYKPAHPGYSPDPARRDTPVYMARLPIECYSRFPDSCKPTPFAGDVNYFRDWRCCEAKPPPAWKPPYAQWATNQHL